jgi:hypothetical protein
MPDRITVLYSRGLSMAKRWKADGAIEPYSRAKHFTWAQHDVSDIRSLSALLSQLEGEPEACIVRGAPKEGSPPTVRRLIESFDDAPLHAVLIEVDNFEPLASDPLDGEEAAREFVTTSLPQEFHNSTFHWQLSNSAGAPGKKHLFKGHIWFWLATPYDSATLRAWAAIHAPAVDRAVLQVVQVHYTAAPVFDPGVASPVAQRSGLYVGGYEDVDLVIDASTLDVRPQGARQRADRIAVEDPQADWLEANWETWGYLADGGILVSCPFAHEHSGGTSGDTSTAYFPAGTGGYAEGSWVCLHNSCRDRPQGEFRQEVGYTDSQFAGLVSQEPGPLQISGRLVNGVKISDPLVLPPLMRDGNGRIMTCITNAQSTLLSPRVSPWRLRYDVFKDAVVRSEWDKENWKPFTDSDYVHLRLLMEDVGVVGVGREMIRDAVHYVAQRDAFDSAINWLESLKWDGIPRIGDFWLEHFGAEDDGTGYAEAVGRYTWTAFAGRVLIPGIQADMVPILSGRQGLRKSRGILALAPTPDFATNMSFNESDVERARKMRGRLVVELAELQGLKSRASEEILAWVTRSEEHWTPKFMEMTTNFKRRFIMIATTNENDILDNPEGERRWLPLKVGVKPGFGQVDAENIARIRDQLWAEGRDRFLKGGIDWQDAERLAKAQHVKWKAGDEWHVAIVRWLDGTGTFIDSDNTLADIPRRQQEHLTTLDVAMGALSLPARTIKPSDQRRIAKIMRKEGFLQELRRVGGEPMRVWVPAKES